MLSGGYKINVIPEQAEMSFDCRLLPGYGRARVRLQPRADWSTIRASSSRSPGPTRRRRQRRVGRAALPRPRGRLQRLRAVRPSSTPSICVGGTDARYFRQRGVPAYGLVPCLFDAEDLKGYHGIDERLSIENLRLGQRRSSSARPCAPPLAERRTAYMTTPPAEPPTKLNITDVVSGPIPPRVDQPDLAEQNAHPHRRSCRREGSTAVVRAAHRRRAEPRDADRQSARDRQPTALAQGLRRMVVRPGRPVAVGADRSAS